jgi:NAD(P)H-flavin reductase
MHHILTHRERYGHLSILQGVKHTDDLIWRRQYDAWAQLPDVEVHLAADVAEPNWHGHVGLVTALFEYLQLEPGKTIAMLCGPEIMMRASAEGLHALGLADDAIYLSMERNMQCAVGHCGHCQIGGNFVCRKGPVFSWPEVHALLGIRGF